MTARWALSARAAPPKATRSRSALGERAREKIQRSDTSEIEVESTSGSQHTYSRARRCVWAEPAAAEL